MRRGENKKTTKMPLRKRLRYILLETELPVKMDFNVCGQRAANVTL